MRWRGIMPHKPPAAKSRTAVVQDRTCARRSSPSILLQWAAKQVMLGRTICAINESTGEVRHLEMPALTAIAEKSQPTFLTTEQVRQRIAEPVRTLGEFASNLAGDRVVRVWLPKSRKSEAD